jgi:hypothetical protein
VLELGSWPEVGDDTRARAVRGRRHSGAWAWCVSKRRAGAAYSFGTEASWAVGRIKGWAEMVPFGLFRILYFFSLFLFLFSDLFHILCKFASNQFNQIPKFFRSSKQGYKPIRNMFSEIKQDF